MKHRKPVSRKTILSGKIRQLRVEFIHEWWKNETNSTTIRGCIWLEIFESGRSKWFFWKPGSVVISVTDWLLQTNLQCLIVEKNYIFDNFPISVGSIICKRCENNRECMPDHKYNNNLFLCVMIRGIKLKFALVLF